MATKDPVVVEADDQGNWTAELPEVSEGDTITVVAETVGKDPSAPITVTVDGLTVTAPTASISGNEIDGYPVVGKAAPDATVEITNAQGDVVGTGTTDGDGNYRIVIAPDQVAPEENLNVAAIVTAGGKTTAAPTRRSLYQKTTKQEPQRLIPSQPETIQLAEQQNQVPPSPSPMATKIL